MRVKKPWLLVLIFCTAIAFSMCLISVLLPPPPEDEYLSPMMPDRPILPDSVFLDGSRDTTGYRMMAQAVDLTPERAGNPFWSAICDAGRVCFVGDSITAGTSNGNYPWFEAMERLIPGDVVYYARGGASAKWMMGQVRRIPTADVYVVSLGRNDIWFRHEEFCAYTPDEYAGCLQTLRDKLAAKSPDAKFVFITPWPWAGEEDLDVDALHDGYAAALADMCAGNGDVYIDPGPAIRDEIFSGDASDYMLDVVHPNARNGIRLYCEAVLDYRPD